ncbi:MAG: hypothetical protein ACK4S4_15620 [Pyrinomonadaceae bacterium]
MPIFEVGPYDIEAGVDADGDLTIFVTRLDGRRVVCTDEDLGDGIDFGTRFTTADEDEDDDQ